MTKQIILRISVIYLALSSILMPCMADEVSANISALRSKSVVKRADAAESLAKLKSRKAIQPLIVALSDPVESV